MQHTYFLARIELTPLQNAKLLRKCTMLEKNLSCLYKTAWAHVRRKDDYIQKLKTQIKVFRQVTGMVTPGVFLDGNHADVPDTAGVPVTSRCDSAS